MLSYRRRRNINNNDNIIYFHYNTPHDGWRRAGRGGGEGRAAEEWAKGSRDTSASTSVGGGCGGGSGDDDEEGRGGGGTGGRGLGVVLAVGVLAVRGAVHAAVATVVVGVVVVVVVGHRRGGRNGRKSVAGRRHVVPVLVGHRLADGVVAAGRPVGFPVAVAGTVAGHAQPALHVHRVPPAVALVRLPVPVLLGVLERHHAGGAHRVLFVLAVPVAAPVPVVPVHRLRFGGGRRGRRGRGRGRRRHRRVVGRLHAVVGLVVVPVVLRDHRRDGIQRPVRTEIIQCININYNITALKKRYT